MTQFEAQLLQRELVTPDDLQRAQDAQQHVGGHIGYILVRLGVLSEDAMLAAWAGAAGGHVFDGADLPMDLSAYQRWLESIGMSPAWMAMQHVIVLPVDRAAMTAAEGGTPVDVTVLMRLGQNTSALEHVLRLMPGISVHLQVARSETVESFLGMLLSHAAEDNPQDNSEHHLRELAEEAPIIELVNNLFAQAADKTASDIHIDPQKHRVLVRFRLDGVLYEQSAFPHERLNAVTSRIKLLADMDIAERRLPQDGRIAVKASGKAFDVRVSTLPGIHGETVVLRLLPTEQKTLSLQHLGMHADHVSAFEQLIHKPHGIFLVTGPTGSGKTTTLYTALDLVNDGSKKVITVEDPVEYQMNNIAQVQVNSDIGLTFASALRTILRQDPDVVMLGEIRDLETAEIAIQASLTGHLVFSTLHTNDSVGAFTRLVDMGVDPFLVATPVIGVMAQRLVRKLCPHCAVPMQADAVTFKRVQAVATRYGVRDEGRLLQAGEGCQHCSGTGYAGRSGIYELVVMTEALREAIIRGESTARLWEVVIAGGGRKLQDDGLLKVWQGETSLDEVLRVSAE